MCSQPPPHLSRSGFSSPHNGWARGGASSPTLPPCSLAFWNLKHNGAENWAVLVLAQYLAHRSGTCATRSDRYANYWNVVRNHALSNHRYYAWRIPNNTVVTARTKLGTDRQLLPTKGYAAHCPATTTMVETSHRQQPCPVFPYTPRNPCALKYLAPKATGFGASTDSLRCLLRGKWTGRCPLSCYRPTHHCLR